MSCENLKRRGISESPQTLAKVPKIKDDDQVINFEEKLDDNPKNKEFKATNTKVCNYFKYSNLRTDYTSMDFQLIKKIDDPKATMNLTKAPNNKHENGINLTNALSFYRSQNILCQSKPFEPAQKFECKSSFCQAQNVCDCHNM